MGHSRMVVIGCAEIREELGDEVMWAALEAHMEWLSSQEPAWGGGNTREIKRSLFRGGSAALSNGNAFATWAHGHAGLFEECDHVAFLMLEHENCLGEDGTPHAERIGWLHRTLQALGVEVLLPEVTYRVDFRLVAAVEGGFAFLPLNPEGLFVVPGPEGEQ